MLVITSHNVVFPDSGDPCPATIEVDTQTGKILNVYKDILFTRSDYPRGTPEWIEVEEGCYLFPGLVDPHVHINEPGRTEWEGFHTGTRAALTGGVTTIVDMPHNSIPPTTTVEALNIKRNAAQGQCWTDVAFWGGIVPGNLDQLVPLVEAGVKGFKCFLIDSGVEEFPCVNAAQFYAIEDKLQNTPTVLMFHAELADSRNDAQTHTDGDPTEYSTFLATRPQSMEVEGIKQMISLQRSFQSFSPHVRFHIAHLSASEALSLILYARLEGMALTAETTFHYLTLVASQIPPGNPQFKCCPPIRDERNRDMLWAGLENGMIDFAVSDHSPSTPSLKCMGSGNVMEARGGIGGVGLGLPLLWEEARRRGFRAGALARILSENPAHHAGLGKSKGQIAVGYDADFVIWNPQGETYIRQEWLEFKNKISPYHGMTFKGEVKETILRGVRVWSRRQGFLTNQGIGRLL